MGQLTPRGSVLIDAGSKGLLSTFLERGHPLAGDVNMGGRILSGDEPLPRNGRCWRADAAFPLSRVKSRRMNPRQSPIRIKACVESDLPLTHKANPILTNRVRTTLPRAAKRLFRSNARGRLCLNLTINSMV